MHTSDSTPLKCHTRKGAPIGACGCNQSKGARNAHAWMKERFGDRKAKKVEAKIAAYFAEVS